MLEQNFFKTTAWGIARAVCVMLITQVSYAEPLSTAVCHAIDERQVIALFTQWNQALQTKNPEQVVATYAPNAVLLSTLSNTPRTNHAQIRAYFTKFLAKEPVATIDKRVIKGGCNWASDTGLYTFQLNDHGQKTSVQARFSYVYEYINDKWLIVSHHSSLMPEKIDPESY